MVEVIQRYGLSASRGAGSSNFSAQVQACLFIVVLNQIHSRRPISLKKKFLRQKTRNDENCLAFQPDFQAHGTRSGGSFYCGNRDSGRKGKRRSVLLANRGMAGLPDGGVLSVGNLARQTEEELSAECSAETPR